MSELPNTQLTTNSQTKCSQTKCSQTKRSQTESSQTESSQTESSQTESSQTESSQTESSQTDFYQILGVSEEATYTEIKKKWLKLSLIYHPDKCGGDNTKFRQINLAYKVLSNPENRKKYNDSLAKTYDQLRDENRDVSYHINRDFMKSESTATGHDQLVFDREKFLQQFEKTRTTQEHLSEFQPVSDQQATEMTKANNRDLESLMAQRDAELHDFQSNQKTEMFNPNQQLDEFNYIFDQYKRLNRARAEVEEVQSGHVPVAAGQAGAAQANDPTQMVFDPTLISEMTRKFTEAIQNPTSGETIEITKSNPENQSTCPADLLNARLAELQAERENLDRTVKDKQFEYATLAPEGTSELLMPSEKELYTVPEQAEWNSADDLVAEPDDQQE